VRKRDFFIILFVVIICIGLSFAVFTFHDTPGSPSAGPAGYETNTGKTR
jgi:hypothetical protein